MKAFVFSFKPAKILSYRSKKVKTLGVIESALLS